MSVRDISIGETFDHKFTTRQYSDGAPTTASGLTIAAYPGNSTTEITAGITTTFTSGFDGRAGLVNVNVVATTGNGYASGTDYALVVTAGTVGGTSIVGEVVGHFTIGRSAAATRVGLLSTSASTGDPGTTTNVVAYLKQLVNVLVGTAGVTTWAAGAAPANAVSLSEGIRYISENLGAQATAASTGDPGSATSGIAYLKQLINILIGTTGITTFPAEAAPANNVSLAEVIRAIHADVTGLNGAAMRGTDNAALASVCTETRLSELDAGTGGKMANQVDIIQTDTTTDIPALLPAALVGGRMDSNASAINNNTTAATQLALSAATVESGACEATPSTTVIQTDLAETQDDIYIGRIIIFTSGNARGEATEITDYAGSTGTLTVTALANAPAASDTFVII